MTFLGGHSYSTAVPYSTNFEAPYLRFFYNSLFFNSAAVANMTLVPSRHERAAGQHARRCRSRSRTRERAPPSASAPTSAGHGDPAERRQLRLDGVRTDADGRPTTATGRRPSPSPQARSATSPGAPTRSSSTRASPSRPPGASRSRRSAASTATSSQESFTNNSCASVLVVRRPARRSRRRPSSTGPRNVGDIVTWTLELQQPGAPRASRTPTSKTCCRRPASRIVSATPAPTSVVPVGGNTRLRWTIGTLAAGGSGSITLKSRGADGGGSRSPTPPRSAATTRPATSTARSSTSTVTVNPPDGQHRQDRVADGAQSRAPR